MSSETDDSKKDGPASSQGRCSQDRGDTGEMQAGWRRQGTSSTSTLWEPRSGDNTAESSKPHIIMISPETDDSKKDGPASSRGRCSQDRGDTGKMQAGWRRQGTSSTPTLWEPLGDEWAGCFHRSGDNTAESSKPQATIMLPKPKTLPQPKAISPRPALKPQPKAILPRPLKSKQKPKAVLPRPLKSKQKPKAVLPMPLSK